MARIPGHRLKRVLWLISTLEKPRSTAWRRRVAPSVVRSACQQVERARVGGGIQGRVSRKEGSERRDFFGRGRMGMGQGLILDVKFLIFN